MTTSNQPDALAERVSGCRVFLATPMARCSPRLGRQVFALVVKLSEHGHFTWKEWAAVLAMSRRPPTIAVSRMIGMHYYEHLLAALERWRSTKA